MENKSVQHDDFGVWDYGKKPQGKPPIEETTHPITEQVFGGNIHRAKALIIKEDKSDYEAGDEEFSLFQKCVLHYIEAMSLNDWDVVFCFREDGEYLANCVADSQSRGVCFNMSKKWGYDEPTPEKINRVAFHEVMELMTSEYDDIIRARDQSLQSNLEWRERVDHALIRRLEKILLPLLPSPVDNPSTK